MPAGAKVSYLTMVVRATVNEDELVHAHGGAVLLSGFLFSSLFVGHFLLACIL